MPKQDDRRGWGQLISLCHTSATSVPGTSLGVQSKSRRRSRCSGWSNRATTTGSPFLDVDGWNKVLLPAPSQTASFYRLREACDPDLGPRGVGKT